MVKRKPPIKVGPIITKLLPPIVRMGVEHYGRKKKKEIPEEVKEIIEVLVRIGIALLTKRAV